MFSLLDRCDNKCHVETAKNKEERDLYQSVLKGRVSKKQDDRIASLLDILGNIGKLIRAGGRIYVDQKSKRKKKN